MSAVVVTLLACAILVVGFLVGLLVGGLATGLSTIAFMALPVLVIGFLIGWLVEWIIDNQYRRLREMGQEAPAQTASLPDTTGNQVAELIGTLKDVLNEREQKVRDLRAELEDQEMAVARLQGEFETYAVMHPDDLTVINGIGRIYQWKLRDVGINTHQALADANPERLREALGIKPWQKVDPASWIEQAIALTETNRSTTKGVRRRTLSQ